MITEYEIRIAALELAVKGWSTDYGVDFAGLVIWIADYLRDGNLVDTASQAKA